MAKEVEFEAWCLEALRDMEGRDGHPDELAVMVPEEFYDVPRVKKVLEGESDYNGSAMFPGRVYLMPDGFLYKT